MAHKTLVGGTAYEIKGGKTLIGGTAYSIKNGKTLVDGTVYGISFAEMATVIITRPPGFVVANHSADYARVTVDGQVYDGSNTVELSVPVGAIIQCDIVKSGNYGYIALNRTVVDSTSYNHVVVSNCTVEVSCLLTSDKFGLITITEE